jgi:hypothetical protein
MPVRSHRRQTDGADNRGQIEGTRMKTFLAKLRNVAMAGFFFLLPVYVLFIILTKAWSSLSSLGGSIAGMFGMKSILGVGGNTVFSGLLFITIWIACGLLVRVSFVAGFSNRVENLLSKYIPGYATYRTMAEEKLRNKVRMLPYSALIKQQEYRDRHMLLSRTLMATAWSFFPKHQTQAGDRS